MNYAEWICKCDGKKYTAEFFYAKDIIKDAVQRVLDGKISALSSAFTWYKSWTPNGEGEVYWIQRASGIEELSPRDIKFLKWCLKQ